MKRLNGWQRLWVLGCFFLGVAIVPFGVNWFPSEAKLDETYQQRAKDFKRLMVYKENPALMPNSFEMGQWKNASVQDLYKASVKDGQQYEDDLRSIKYVQAKFLGKLTLGWGLCCLALLLLGYFIAWVVNGFRS